MIHDYCSINAYNTSALTIFHSFEQSFITRKPPIKDGFLHLEGSYKDYEIRLSDDEILVEDKRASPSIFYEFTGLKSGSIKFFGFDDLGKVSVRGSLPYQVSDIVDVESSDTVRINAESLLYNDKDYRGSELKILDVDNAIGGKVHINKQGSIFFTSNPDFKGIRSFEYHIQNKLGFKNTTPIKVYLREPHHPNDPEFFTQWYLFEMRVSDIWKDYTGKNVKVAVLDEGYIPNNPDIEITKNHYQVDYDGSPLGQHGLMVASVIGSKHNNSIGMAGIAPDSDLSSIQIPLGGGKNDATERLKIFSDYDIINNSWGYSFNARCGFNMNYELSIDPQSISTEEMNDMQSIEDASVYGRDGKGSIIVFAGGNTLHGDSNFVASRVNPYNIIVGGYTKPEKDLEVFEKNTAHFAASSSQTLVAAPASHFTTSYHKNLMIINDKIESESGNLKVAGTSFASPSVAATIALMLEANPELGWRDVQDILAYSALPKSEEGEVNAAKYSVNGAKNSNGGGLLFNKEYGFGVADIHGAVRLSETWGSKNTFNNYLNLQSQPKEYGKILFKNNFQENFSQNKEMEIEYLKLKISASLLSSKYTFSDLSFKIISPSNTTYTVLEKAGYNSLIEKECINLGNNIDWEFGFQHARGDSGKGIWQVSISGPAGANLKFKPYQIGLDFYGKSKEYLSKELIYTDSFSIFEKDTRDKINYTLKDFDTINTVAVTSGVKIDLSGDSTSRISGKKITFSAGHKIKNIKAGDGDDELIGNDISNTFMPGRGNDNIYTGGGNNIIHYPNLNWSNLGHDVIHDFDIDNDKIKIGKINYSDLLTLIKQPTNDNSIPISDTIIGNQTWSITLKNVSPTLITEDTFILDYTE